MDKIILYSNKAMETVYFSHTSFLNKSSRIIANFIKIYRWHPEAVLHLLHRAAESSVCNNIVYLICICILGIYNA